MMEDLRDLTMLAVIFMTPLAAGLGTPTPTSSALSSYSSTTPNAAERFCVTTHPFVSSRTLSRKLFRSQMGFTVDGHVISR